MGISLVGTVGELNLPKGVGFSYGGLATAITKYERNAITYQ
jgi:hypothetical protein